jgi:hypothetical protein
MSAGYPVIPDAAARAYARELLERCGDSTYARVAVAAQCLGERLRRVSTAPNEQAAWDLARGQAIYEALCELEGWPCR